MEQTNVSLTPSNSELRRTINAVAPLRSHRQPLAVLDPQSALPRLSDDPNQQLPPMFAYPHQQSDPKDHEFNPDFSSYCLGRPIISRSTQIGEDLDNDPPAVKPVVTSSPSGTGLQPDLHTPLRPMPHHPRRASVPSAHYRPTSATLDAEPSTSNPPAPNPAYINNDELYSSLGTFTFGAAQPTRSSTPDSEMIDPFSQRLVDPRPRRSLSSVMTPRDDEVDDEAGGIRNNRAKMRAIDDGSRRPSLPLNDPLQSPRRHRHNRSSIDTTATARASMDVDRSSTYTFGFAGIYQRYGGPYSEDEDDEEGLDESSSSPVVFANSQQLFSDDEAEDDQYHYVPPAGDTQRRDSLPMDIPGSATSTDSSSIRTRRKMSRSLDDDISTLNHGLGNMMRQSDGGNARSEPLTRGEWSNFEQHFQQRTPSLAPDDTVDENPLEGLNLAYIFSGNANTNGPRQSWSSGGSFVQHQPTPASHAHTFGLRFINGGIDSRRPSAATIGEDTFFKHLRSNDETYALRLGEWTFSKEKADGQGPLAKIQSGHKDGQVLNTIFPGGHEIWRCQVVGRFTVERLTLPAEAESLKPPQHRLKVRHIADPYSVNTRGGPSVVIHKHSRALAFSIFRSHDLFKPQTHQLKANGRLDTSNSILLATRKVQEMYTVTKTSKKLKTHGLLDESPRDDDRSERGSRKSEAGPLTRPRSRSVARKEKEKREKDRERDKVKKKDKNKDKDKGKDKPREYGWGFDTGVSSQTTSRDSTISTAQDKLKNDNIVSSWARHLSGRHTSPPPGQSPPPVPSPPQAVHLSSASTSSQASSVADSGAWNTSLSTLDPTSPFANYHPTSHSSSSQLTLDTGEDDEEDIDDVHQPVQRRSHAETYDSLTPIHHEHARQNFRPNVPSTSKSKVAFRIFPRRSGNISDWPPNSPTAAMVPSPVPWMLTDNSERLEEGHVVMTNLNDNFGAVGLVPPRQTNRVIRPTRPRREENMLLKVPEDSLYMVLPLFAGETDPEFMPAHWDPSFEVPVDQRKYLLVYYVPFDKGKKKDNKKPDSQTSMTFAEPGKSKSVFLSSFRVSSHLMTYNDFRGSNVRLPSLGLSVTGSLERAVPPDVTPDNHMDAIAIAQCTKRESGIEFLPEGLHKLGLCQAEKLPQISDGNSDDGHQEVELKFELSPIGRAVVEMAWMGAMAVTSFGSV